MDGFEGLGGFCDTGLVCGEKLVAASVDFRERVQCLLNPVYRIEFLSDLFDFC